MHSLCLGMTESGKSLLCKILAAKLQQAGKPVAVLDPLYSHWESTYKSLYIEEIDTWLQQNRQAFAFIDECGRFFGAGSDDYTWFATLSRHYGHSVMFIAQRATQVPKTIRDQCSRLYLFTSSMSDCKVLADEYNSEVLVQATRLPRLSFFVVDRYSSARRCRIVDYKEVVDDA